MGTTWDREERPEVIFITCCSDECDELFCATGSLLMDLIFTVRSHLASSPKAGIDSVPTFIYGILHLSAACLHFCPINPSVFGVSLRIHTLIKPDFSSPKLGHSFKLKLNLEFIPAMAPQHWGFHRQPRTCCCCRRLQNTSTFQHSWWAIIHSYDRTIGVKVSHLICELSSPEKCHDVARPLGLSR